MARYNAFPRGRHGVYYLEDSRTGKQTSLRTKDKEEAQRLLHAYNEAENTSEINRKIATAYMAASDAKFAARTWKDVFEAYLQRTALACRGGIESSTYERTVSSMKDQAFDLIKDQKITSTHSEDFMKVLKKGGVATNLNLRRIHNWVIDMGWILQPILVRRAWPKVRFKTRRGITLEEHQKILQGEPNDESRLFYQFLWETGAAQGDAANLHRDDINETEGIIAFQRQKLRDRECGYVIIQIDQQLRDILEKLPKEGFLFPWLKTLHTRHRASAFQRRCQRVGVKGVSMHCYRYAWAERALSVAYPERFAMERLGHSSKAVHRAYAKSARVVTPSLNDYQAAASAAKVIRFDQAA